MGVNLPMPSGSNSDTKDPLLAGAIKKLQLSNQELEDAIRQFSRNGMLNSIILQLWRSPPAEEVVQSMIQKVRAAHPSITEAVIAENENAMISFVKNKHGYFRSQSRKISLKLVKKLKGIYLVPKAECRNPENGQPYTDGEIKKIMASKASENLLGYFYLHGTFPNDDEFNYRMLKKVKVAGGEEPEGSTAAVSADGQMRSDAVGSVSQANQRLPDTGRFSSPFLSDLAIDIAEKSHIYTRNPEAFTSQQTVIRLMAFAGVVIHHLLLEAQSPAGMKFESDVLEPVHDWTVSSMLATLGDPLHKEELGGIIRGIVDKLRDPSLRVTTDTPKFVKPKRKRNSKTQA
ncbi:hypothetical protein MIND_01127200 [Mycena indigotica]|uniref:Uncharacterized protein n=1 Tax=Mycena indigotica TaxID=2126181 RepID=A0A8H6VX82_9AGAR|nr:uncharacterized protein MIND_01127200 [Mycena indigotica]KAF7293493.1 hypothetical protein MIND_01127200 [Mycena indigotica]